MSSFSDLDILAVGLVRLMIRAPTLGDKRFRQFEHVAVNAVEPAGDGMAQLHVLLLILAHRHQIGLVQQNVRRHQSGIGEQTAVDVVRILADLSLNWVMRLSSPNME